RYNIIHGDIKPANILITAESRPKLTDFGMARLASHQRRGDTSLLGTPAYWCPEQIMGRPQDGRSDIFSLGAVLYEMLTGKSPFAGENLQKVCTLVLSSRPLPLSRINGSIPGAVDEFLAGCLAKDSNQRFASAETLAERLYPLARRKAAEAAPAQVADSAQRGRMARFL